MKKALRNVCILVTILISFITAMRMISPVVAQSDQDPYQVHITFASGGENYDSMHVTWFTNGSCPSIVKLGTASGVYTKTIQGQATNSTSLSKYIHEANVTGLLPSTKYYYVAGSNGHWSMEYTFRTADLGDASSFKFVAYGDTRTNRTARSQVLNAINDEIDTNDVRFVLHDGDFVEVGNDPLLWYQWFADSATVGSKVPIMGTTGNHEATPDASDIGYWGAQYQNPPNGPLRVTPTDQGNDYTYWFVYDSVFIIELDWNFNYGDTTSSDYAWLNQTLDHANAMRNANIIYWIVVMAHSPPYCSNGHGNDTTEQNNLCPVLESRGVDLEIGGHTHYWERNYQLRSPGAKIINTNTTIKQGLHDTVPGTVYIVSGAGGAPLVTDWSNTNLCSAAHYTDFGYGLVTVTKSTNKTQSTLHIECRDINRNVVDSGITLVKTGIPLMSPKISSPPDERFEYASTGNAIAWNITSMNINRSAACTVYENDTPFTGFNNISWAPGIPVNVSIDGLLPGSYNFTIVATDGMSTPSRDMIIINVFDVPPSIVHQAPAGYEFGTISHSINWTITDASTTMRTCTILRNGTQVISSSWNSNQPVSFNIDGLDPGTYNFTIIASDGLGGSTQDSVLITVQSTTGGSKDQSWIGWLIVIAVLCTIFIPMTSLGIVRSRKRKTLGM